MTRKFTALGVGAAIALGALSLAAAPGAAQEQKPLRVGMNADPDVLDMNSPRTGRGRCHTTWSGRSAHCRASSGVSS